MRILAPAIALLAATALACSNDSKLQDTAMHGPAGANGDTVRSAGTPSGAPTPAPSGSTSTDTSAAKKRGTP